MSIFDYSCATANPIAIGEEATKIVQVSDFFVDPDAVMSAAADRDYAQINPQYPGIRAAVEPDLLAALCSSIGEMTAQQFGGMQRPWIGQAWYSIVTRPASELTPIQRLPHFDGFDESQLAVMIYLNQTDHGGTAFYRQRKTGYERVTEARFPAYKAALEQGVQQSGLPPAQYITDGAPHFEKIYESDAAYNSLILYPGTSLHSGVIRNDVPLPADPQTGRLTINGFFRPG